MSFNNHLFVLFTNHNLFSYITLHFASGSQYNKSFFFRNLFQKTSKNIHQSLRKILKFSAFF